MTHGQYGCCHRLDRYGCHLPDRYGCHLLDRYGCCHRLDRYKDVRQALADHRLAALAAGPLEGTSR
ncbi:hypothetical protein [Streptomyces sp. NPDC058247]|uniref:hypothetical protein n=1 Tax=Streptomyces sp. NPDC058247 TaxID=3346401 RepID=UPI0036EC4AD9